MISSFRAGLFFFKEFSKSLLTKKKRLCVRSETYPIQREINNLSSINNNHHHSHVSVNNNNHNNILRTVHIPRPTDYVPLKKVSYLPNDTKVKDMYDVILLIDNR